MARRRHPVGEIFPLAPSLFGPAPRPDARFQKSAAGRCASRASGRWRSPIFSSRAGGEILSEAFRAGLVNEAAFFIAPSVTGTQPRALQRLPRAAAATRGRLPDGGPRPALPRTALGRTDARRASVLPPPPHGGRRLPWNAHQFRGSSSFTCRKNVVRFFRARERFPTKRTKGGTSPQ